MLCSLSQNFSQKFSGRFKKIKLNFWEQNIQKKSLLIANISYPAKFNTLRVYIKLGALSERLKIPL